MSDTSSSALTITPLLLALALLLSACSTVPAPGFKIDASGRAELTDDFRNGATRLQCDTSCSGSWGGSRRNLRALHDAELWNDLALEVLRIGFRGDLPYFYLGRAAEGLGYNSAADTYYRFSLSGYYKCNGLFNNCDGFVFPDDVKSRIAGVLVKREEEYRKARFNLPQERATGSSEAAGTPSPDRYQVNCNRAYTEYFEKAQSTRENEKVIALYRAGLTLCPEDDIAHYELGKALASRKRYAEAEQEFAAALKINPDFADAKKQLEAVRKNSR